MTCSVRQFGRGSVPPVLAGAAQLPVAVNSIFLFLALYLKTISSFSSPMLSRLSCLPTFTNEAVVKLSLHQLPGAIPKDDVMKCPRLYRSCTLFSVILRPLAGMSPNVPAPPLTTFKIIWRGNRKGVFCALCSEGTTQHNGAAIRGAQRSCFHWGSGHIVQGYIVLGTHRLRDEESQKKTLVNSTKGTLRHSIVRLCCFQPCSRSRSLYCITAKNVTL